MTGVKVVSEEFVQRTIICWLSSHGWGASLRFGALHDKGVDIKVRHNKYSRYFLIETKGEGSATSKSRNSQKETHFVFGLGQIVTRMNCGGSTRNYYGLGLPESSAKIALRRLPWQVAKKLLLHIFSVNGNGEVVQFSWKELKKIQEK